MCRWLIQPVWIPRLALIFFYLSTALALITWILLRLGL